MVRELRHIRYEELENDLATILDRIAREDESVVVDKDGNALVVVTPARRAKPARRRGERTRADYSAFRSAAGGWKDVDTDRLVEDIYTDRRLSDRPPIDL